jgi:metal-responsive CopG/Arc/MetJ family transcriptional regulator
MRVTLTLPDHLAKRFLVTIPSRERSATVARLLEQDLARREQALEAACLAANADTALAAEIEEWQAFDDGLEDANEP